MNKKQYITQLNEELRSLSEQERSEAVLFYEEYLVELEENNPTKLESLESPHEIGTQIKAEMAMNNAIEKDIKKKKGISTAWTVLLAIFALPIGLPVTIAVAAIGIALIIVALSLIISLFAVTFSLIVSAFAAFAAAVVLIPTDFSVSIFYLGLGLLGLGLGYMSGIGVYIFSKNLFVWIAKIINNMRLRIQNKQKQKKELNINE